jgi:hypothetical protein
VWLPLSWSGTLNLFMRCKWLDEAKQMKSVQWTSEGSLVVLQLCKPTSLQQIMHKISWSHPYVIISLSHSYLDPHWPLAKISLPLKSKNIYICGGLSVVWWGKWSKQIWISVIAKLNKYPKPVQWNLMIPVTGRMMEKMSRGKEWSEWHNWCRETIDDMDTTWRVGINWWLQK